MCGCINKVNEQITKHNSIIEYNLLADRPKAMISTCKVEPRKRVGPIKIFASYCPFCGEKYSEV